jgi:hypothetical protein
LALPWCFGLQWPFAQPFPLPLRLQLALPGSSGAAGSSAAGPSGRADGGGTVSPIVASPAPPTGEVAASCPLAEVRGWASRVLFAVARLAGGWGWKLGAVTRATSLEAAGADGSCPASFEGEKRTTGAVATSANAPATASRPIAGITARVKRRFMDSSSPFGTRLPLVEF